MQRLITTLKQFVRDEDGVTAIEYGLIASLVAVAIIAGAGTLGNSLNNTFSYISTQVK